MLRKAIELLGQGRVVAYPTDTLYGLAADARRDDAIERLYRIKARDASVPVPLVAGSLAQALAAGTFCETSLRLATMFWPGALSIVVPASGGISSRVLGPDGTVALRVPAHPVARALAFGLGAPITATSANMSGQPPCASAEGVVLSLGEKLDGIIDGGPTPGGLPSTIVRVIRGVPELLRAGAVDFDRVLKSLQ